MPKDKKCFDFHAGSDFPHAPAKVILAKKRHFDENKEYDGIREKNYAENAVRLLKEEKA